MFSISIYTLFLFCAIHPTPKGGSFSHIFVIKSDIGNIRLINLTMLTLKKWIIKESNDGLSYGTIHFTHSLIKSSIDEYIKSNRLRIENPADFSTTNVIPCIVKSPRALTREEVDKALLAISNSTIHDAVYIMINTGMRGGELCGLTFNDIDMEKRVIFVRHQLLDKQRDNMLHIADTKTKDSHRDIPMIDGVYQCFARLLKADRPSVEPSIDGYSNFIFLKRNGEPMYIIYINTMIKYYIDQYNKKNKNDHLEYFSSHFCRHTFCTNCINAGMNIKTVQYLMGHSSVSITLDVYTSIKQPKEMADEMRMLNFTAKRTTNEGINMPKHAEICHS